MWYTQTASGSYKPNTGDDMRYVGRHDDRRPTIDDGKGPNQRTIEVDNGDILQDHKSSPFRPATTINRLDYIIEDVLVGWRKEDERTS